MRSLTQAARALLHEFADEQIPLVVRGVEWPCWRCHSTTWVPALIHVDGFTDIYSVIRAVSDLRLSYLRECLILCGSPLAHTIKTRHSKRAGYYLSHGCPNCDALAGAFFLDEAITEALVNNTVGRLPLIAAFRRPNLEYLLLAADRDNSHWYDD
ncbi:hypothetical protein [Actinomyces marmotae]|uniref:Uncharacterized protein n=1 Tax=Actinomyces marmotae TaxID=2737173 RepID=A0A6M8B9J8_9ACTO|nr:hypothetical protein [Actinomyces marmotae]QKD80091.1 hypothetical protein HPC72_07545 [Actinomyces marmotae]